MTFWQLAQSWSHDFEIYRRKRSEAAKERHSPRCRRCQLEKLLREKEAQWLQNAQDAGQRTERENEVAWSVTMAHIHDLGVPESEEK